MTTKLELYNMAGNHLRQERLLDLTEDCLLRRELDEVYDASILQCLEESLFLFATRSVQIAADPSIDTSDFGGYAYGFTLPTDFVRIAAIATDAFFSPGCELKEYDITGPGKTLYAAVDSFFLKYISKDASYGLNLAIWPQTFAMGVGARLAENCAMRVTKSRDDEKDCRAKAQMYLGQSKVRDAVDDRVKQQPPGRLVRARRGGNAMRSNGPLWG